eukprot:g18418.t1
MPDASVGEAAHQMNKKVNKSSSGRNAAAHYIRRVNMDQAIVALAEGNPWNTTREMEPRSRKLVEHPVGGRGVGGPECGEVRCPDCWLDSSTLDEGISCTRFKHGAPPQASSGLGRWKGGDVKASTRAGPPDD